MRVHRPFERGGERRHGRLSRRAGGRGGARMDVHARAFRGRNEAMVLQHELPILLGDLRVGSPDPHRRFGRLPNQGRMRDGRHQIRSIGSQPHRRRNDDRHQSIRLDARGFADVVELDAELRRRAEIAVDLPPRDGLGVVVSSRALNQPDHIVSATRHKANDRRQGVRLVAGGVAVRQPLPVLEFLRRQRVLGPGQIPAGLAFFLLIYDGARVGVVAFGRSDACAAEATVEDVPSQRAESGPFAGVRCAMSASRSRARS